MENQIVYEFARNENQRVRLSLREYKGRHYMDLRVFYQPEDSSEMRATRKGITLALELLPEVKKGIAVCEKKLTAMKSATV
ncbi:MAG: transcriptional coactivator p15/PC4 family protein [Candidatus Omnitrophica bacterium]|nr:transcriptional coactivator p15/PC4 family protein [Candidatus Omnitrophota bacterium]